MSIVWSVVQTGNLGCIRKNIKTKMPKVLEIAYNTLVRPHLGYASAVCDPHTKKKQKNGYPSSGKSSEELHAGQLTSLSDMQLKILQKLGWRTLE